MSHGVGAALTSACDGSGVGGGAGGALLACDVEVELVKVGAGGSLLACDVEVKLVEVELVEAGAGRFLTTSSCCT